MSLFPSAVADAAAGVVLGAGAWPGGAAPLLLAGGSLAVYHGALALNDWADRARDAAARPERPLPRGDLRPESALVVAVLLLFAGLAGAAWAGARAGGPAGTGAALALGLAAVLAVAYDLGPRGPRLGPALLAGCRGLDLAAGVLLGAALAAPGAGAPRLGLAAALLYAAYVHQVSALGRLEDGEDDLGAGRPARHLRRAALALALVGSLPAARAVALAARAPQLAELLPLVPSLWGAAGLWRLSARTAWERADVVRAMGAALRRLLVFTATCAASAGHRDGLLVALVALAGYPVSHGLRRVFPPS